MSPSQASTATARPPLAAIAESIHHASTDLPVGRLVFVRFEPAATVSLGFWDLPAVGGHPMEPLIGFRAPSSWHALGLVSSGRLRSLDQPHVAARRVATTVLAHRDGQVVSVLDNPGGGVQVLHETPVGLVPDVLARSLGRATPPPDRPVTVLIEATWLDRLATGLLPHPSHSRTWRWLADRHPLRGHGPVPAPEELAARVAAYGDDQTWSTVRASQAGAALPAATVGPPDGTVLGAEDWFDDGSLSRWLLGQLPPPEVLLPDLVAVLSPPVGEALLTALEGGAATWG